jgi:hypothetical protein
MPLADMFKLGDRIVAKMGSRRRFDTDTYINVIDEPQYFDGSTCYAINDTKGNPVSLTDVDRD